MSEPREPVSSESLGEAYSKQQARLRTLLGYGRRAARAPSLPPPEAP